MERFSLRNDSGSPLTIAAMAVNNDHTAPFSSVGPPFSSVGLSLRPHGTTEFAILQPTSSMPWRVEVLCREAVYLRPEDDIPWQRMCLALEILFRQEHNFFEKRGGVHFSLHSQDFENWDSQRVNSPNTSEGSRLAKDGAASSLSPNPQP